MIFLRFLLVNLRSVAIVASGVLLLVQCGPSSAPSDHPMQRKYQLSDTEAAAWDRLYVGEADSIATEFWGYVGNAQFDQALLMIQRYGDEKMTGNFERRLKELWPRMVNWPADQILNEPQIQLGDGHTVGFKTWGELWSGGFQRAILANDSITVYFIFKGYWETDVMPLYAAVACGDFGETEPQWRPFAHMIFSVDESVEAEKALKQGYRARSLEEFLVYLKSRTFGSFGF